MTLEDIQKLIKKISEDLSILMEAMAHIMENQKGGPGSGRKPGSGSGESEDDSNEDSEGEDNAKRDEDGNLALEMDDLKAPEGYSIYSSQAVSSDEESCIFAVTDDKNPDQELYMAFDSNGESISDAVETIDEARM